MPRKIEITCDGCKTDITVTGAMPTYRLKLSSEEIHQIAGFRFTAVPDTIIEQDAYFCGLVCLKNWLEPKCQHVLPEELNDD
jgi:hypothetical protein